MNITLESFEKMCPQMRTYRWEPILETLVNCILHTADIVFRFRSRIKFDKNQSNFAHQCKFALVSKVWLFFVKFNPRTKSNKTGTSQVGAISKAQKAQNIFLRTKLEIFKKKFFRKMSHCAEKCKRGDPFWFINTHSVAKYQKTRRGDPLGTLKKLRKKVSQRWKKIERGGGTKL